MKLDPKRKSISLLAELREQRDRYATEGRRNNYLFWLLDELEKLCIDFGLPLKKIPLDEYNRWLKQLLAERANATESQQVAPGGEGVQRGSPLGPHDQFPPSGKNPQCTLPDGAPAEMAPILAGQRYGTSETAGVRAGPFGDADDALGQTGPTGQTTTIGATTTFTGRYTESVTVLEPAVDIGAVLMPELGRSKGVSKALPEPEGAVAKVADAVAAGANAGPWPLEAELRVRGYVRNPALLAAQLVVDNQKPERSVSMYRGQRAWRVGDVVKARLAVGGGSPIYKPV